MDWAAQSAINAPGWAAQVNTVSAVRRAVERVVTVTKLTLPTVDVATTPVDVVTTPVTPATVEPAGPVDVSATVLTPATPVDVPTVAVALPVPDVKPTVVTPAATVVQYVPTPGFVRKPWPCDDTGTVTVATPSTSIDATTGDIKIEGADSKGSSTGTAVAAGTARR